MPKEAGPQVLLKQWTIIVNNRFRRSHFVDNSCGTTRSRTSGRINIWTYFCLRPVCCREGPSGRAS